MLTFFKVERHFNRLHASIVSELTKPHPKNGSKWEAQLLVTYDRRIVFNALFSASDVEKVNTPEKAEAWLSQDMGERGSWMEAAEHQYRTSEEARKALKHVA